MSTLRFLFGLWTGKLLHALTRIIGRGGGTAMPGLVALRLCPGFLERITKDLRNGSIAVTGTNGKTTTTRMISDILRAKGYNPISNRQGSNLARGLASAALDRASLRGRLSGDIGLWETDEAAFLPVADAVKPRLVVVNNLFRDQLDRYGEVERLRLSIKEAISRLPDESVLVLNADDPSVASLADGFQGRVVFFGLGDESWRLKGKVHAIDVRSCRRCGGPLKYRINFLGHLGDWRCTKCESRRPKLDVKARDIVHKGMTGMDAIVETRKGSFEMRLNLSGIYNVYNVLAAAAACEAMGVDLEIIEQSVQRFRPAFGRFERLEIEGRVLYLLLIKNPTGCNAVLETLLAANKEPFHVLVAINDLTADGRDVSWLWDADFELLRNKISFAWTAGIRAADMTLRLKYAGIDMNNTAEIGDLESRFMKLLHSVPKGKTLYCLPTYTAMLKLQDILARKGFKARYWRE
ncbi:DUF1727 domain-containing protein [bacterium]|nr:DUF1727 domain-containing protein [bacterium]